MQLDTINKTLPLLLIVVLTSCASPTPQLDSKFGDAVNAAKAQQILNPDASQNADPAMGMDGKAADATINRYYKTMESPPTSGNVFTIGVGAGDSGGTTSGGSPP